MRIWLWPFLDTMNVLTLTYFFILNSIYLVTSLFAFGALRRHVYRMKALYLEDMVNAQAAPSVTILVPAYNEESTCVESIRSLLTLIYYDYEVIVVNDGSKDHTLQALIQAFEMVVTPRLNTGEIKTKEIHETYRSPRHPNLWMIHKKNGGKSDALNAGLNYCRTPLFCAIDADTVIERDALVRIVRPFLEDVTTVAVGGIIRIANDCVVDSGVLKAVQFPKSWLVRFQILEYLRAFLSGRMGWNAVNATLVISGAFGMFRRRIVVDAGGFATDTVGEDMELVVRLHRYCLESHMSYRVTYVPDPVAWTECPRTYKILARQRDRWQRGLAESLWRHRVMLLNPRYKTIGLLAYPYFFFLEMLGPVIEALGYISFAATLSLGLVSGYYFLAFLTMAIFVGVALSIAAVGLEELSLRRFPRLRDLLKLFGVAILENFGYRQLLAFYRLGGMLSFCFRIKRWGKMEKKGFDQGVAA